jgi:hypothetical protein
MRSPLTTIIFAASIGLLVSPPSIQGNVKVVPVDACQEDSIHASDCGNFEELPKEQPSNPEVIRIKLYEDSASSEWIRLEKNGNLVKILRLYEWDDHPVSQIVFRRDRCSTVSSNTSQIVSTKTEDKFPCAIVSASDTILIPDDIRRGSFTIEYTEGSIARTVTFKIRD